MRSFLVVWLLLRFWRVRIFAGAVAAFCALALFLPTANAQQRLEGLVVDSSGAVVAGAQVTLTAPDFHTTQTTGADGRFVFNDLSASSGQVRVQAPGFSVVESQWVAGDGQPLRLVLVPAPVAEQLTVTATRTQTRLSDTPASVVVLGRADLTSAGAITLDDVLRQVPGFSVFRRSGSLAANPTTEGVSLRGVGASGASRALVLYNGVPLNDPFGGWVYWDRVPAAAISGVEVMRGAASDLYGTSAMSGVVDVMPRSPETSALTVESFLGNHLTPEGSLFGTKMLGKWAVSGSGEAFSTDGYLLVDPQDRGRVDVPATEQHRAGNVAVERNFGGAGHAFVSGSLFHEDRGNGTPDQINNTRLGEIVAGGDWNSQAAGAFTFRLYGSGERFFQTFSTIAANRNSEALNRVQVVPSQREGLSAYWSRPVHNAHTLVAGFEAADIRGHSYETAFANGRAGNITDQGGRQRIYGVFGEDVWRLGPKWLLTAALRLDTWSNFDAFTNLFPTRGTPTFTPFAQRDQSALSPRVSLLRRVNRNLSLAASGYRAFRAPTLNELYRPFRVGNRMTLANAGLEAEQLTGAEGSGILNGAGGKLSLRATFFYDQIARPIANVTLISTPALITQQRQNLGKTGSAGLELQGEARVSSALTLSAGYQLADATVLDFAANRALQGLWVPQVPRHQFSLQARYFRPKWALLALQGRYVGTQFDDDQNLFPLDRFFTLDAYVSRSMTRHLELFAAAENLTGQRYMVGRTPTATWGPPILARGGVRLDFGGR